MDPFLQSILKNLSKHLNTDIMIISTCPLALHGNVGMAVMGHRSNQYIRALPTWLLKSKTKNKTGGKTDETTGKYDLDLFGDLEFETHQISYR